MPMAISSAMNGQNQANVRNHPELPHHQNIPLLKMDLEISGPNVEGLIADFIS